LNGDPHRVTVHLVALKPGVVKGSVGHTLRPNLGISGHFFRSSKTCRCRPAILSCRPPRSPPVTEPTRPGLPSCPPTLLPSHLLIFPKSYYPPSFPPSYLPTWLIRKRPPLGPYRRPMSRVPGWSQGGGCFPMGELALSLPTFLPSFLMPYLPTGVPRS